jgi:type IV secretion system protein VirB4
MPDLVRVMSGRKDTVEQCATLRARLGDDPANWLPEFCGWGRAS